MEGKEQKHEYDIRNELGPYNKYEDLAGKAYIFGVQTKNSRLTEMGLNLWKLLNQIKFNDDKFYIVEEKSHELEKILKNINFQEESFCIKTQNDTEILFTKKRTEGSRSNKPFVIVVGSDRFQNSPSLFEDIKNIAEEILDYLRVNKDQIEIEEYGNPLTKSNFREAYYRNPKGKKYLLYTEYEHKHEGASEFAYDFSFYLEKKECFDLWNMLKNKQTLK